jgi:hypothetical protein
MEQTVEILFVNVNNTLGVRGPLQDAVTWAWVAGSHPAPAADFVVAVYQGEIQQPQFKVLEDGASDSRRWFDLTPTSALIDLLGPEELQSLCGEMCSGIKLVRAGITPALANHSAAA